MKTWWGCLVTLGLLLVSCAAPSGKVTASVVQGGQATLGAEVVRLDGTWRFFPGVWFDPALGENADPEKLWNSPGSMGLTVPSIWDRITPTLGKGTYQLRVGGLVPGELYGFQFKGINTRAWVYAGRKLLGTWGGPKVDFVPHTYHVIPETNEVLLTVAVENTALASGGLWLPVVAGPATELEQSTGRDRLFETVLFGSVLMMGLYHLFLFAFRTRDKAPLFFALFCIASALKASLSGEQLLAFQIPLLDQDLGLRMAYLLVISFPITFVAYLQAVFPTERARWIQTLVLSVGAVQAVVTVFWPLLQVQAWFWPFQMVILVVCGHCVSVLVGAIRRQRPGAVLMLIGFLILFVATVNDILHDNKLIVTFYSLNLGLFGFLFAQALIMGSLSSKTFQDLEDLNNTLEQRVAERTRDLEVQSRSDALTGLMNRRYFWELLNQEWERWVRYGQDFTLVMVDIDHFKAINDQYGHAVGDEALLKVAELLQSNVRMSDSVARYGGEEFCLLLPGISASEAQNVLEKMRLTLVDSAVLKEHTKDALTFSYGIAQASRHANAQDTFNAADLLMYQAKQAGRNRGVVEG